MNKLLRSRIKEWLEPSLDRRAGCGLLDAGEQATVCALLQVLAWDESVPKERCRRYVEARTSEEAGLLSEYRSAVRLLRAATRRLFGDQPFEALPLDGRERVLRGLLRRFPHEERQARWRRLTRLTDENVDVALSRRAVRRFRLHVVRDLLRLYYTSAAGWAVVGYTNEFMGKVKSEDDPTEVVSLRVDGGEIVLQLSDATFEELDPGALEMDGERGFAVTTKAGRQRATFSRNAYNALTELIEESSDGFQLRIGARVVPILAGRTDL
jgi:hypothetical protein